MTVSNTYSACFFGKSSFCGPNNGNGPQGAPKTPLAVLFTLPMTFDLHDEFTPQPFVPVEDALSSGRETPSRWKNVRRIVIDVDVYPDTGRFAFRPET